MEHHVTSPLPLSCSGTSGPACWCSSASSWTFTARTGTRWSCPRCRTSAAGYWTERRPACRPRMSSPGGTGTSRHPGPPGPLSLHLSQGVCRRLAALELHHWWDMADRTGHWVQTLYYKKGRDWAHTGVACLLLALHRPVVLSDLLEWRINQPIGRWYTWWEGGQGNAIVICLQFCSIGVERCRKEV